MMVPDKLIKDLPRKYNGTRYLRRAPLPSNASATSRHHDAAREASRLLPPSYPSYIQTSRDAR